MKQARIGRFLSFLAFIFALFLLILLLKNKWNIEGTIQDIKGLLGI